MDTPLGPADGVTVSTDVVVVPVLRAGLGMLDAVLSVVPHARVGHIGLQRDEATAVASQYYAKFPSGLDASLVVLVDPMLATGGSAVAALQLLASRGATQIRLLCIVAAPEGIREVEAHFPDVQIYTPAIDSHLNAPQVHRARPRRLRRSALRHGLTRAQHAEGRLLSRYGVGGGGTGIFDGMCPVFSASSIHASMRAACSGVVLWPVVRASIQALGAVMTL